MKFTIGTISNFQNYENDIKLIKASLLYADEIELIGLTEYAVFKYLPWILDGQKSLDDFIRDLLPFLHSINIPNKSELLQQLQSVQDQLQIYAPILQKKKHRTTKEIQAQIKVKQLKGDLQLQLTEAMEQLIADPSSKELQSLVEKEIIRIYDYKMQSMNTNEMTGSYFGNMMNAIYAANTYPLFDEDSAKCISSIANTRLNDIFFFMTGSSS